MLSKYCVSPKNADSIIKLLCTVLTLLFSFGNAACDEWVNQSSLRHFFIHLCHFAEKSLGPSTAPGAAVELTEHGVASIRDFPV